jgi:hypothetical protein
MKQWHPVFAELLRPALEAYYEVQTNVPVGDAPREADLVVLRRTTQAPLPFRGLWRHLTSWNVLEFKGPTVTPRLGDIDLLIELGLGIDRRLHEQRTQQRQRRLPPEDVSFWYLVNQLGRRFLREAERKLGALEALGPGVWRCILLGHLVFLVSSVDLPVEVDSLPLLIVGKEPPATEREVARLVVAQPELQERYGGWMLGLHPEAWKEVEAMARATGKRLLFDIRPAVEHLGLGHFIEQVGVDRVIEEIGDKELAKRVGIDRWLATLSPAKRRELKRRLH